MCQNHHPTTTDRKYYATRFSGRNNPSGASSKRQDREQPMSWSDDEDDASSSCDDYDGESSWKDSDNESSVSVSSDDSNVSSAASLKIEIKQKACGPPPAKRPTATENPGDNNTSSKLQLPSSEQQPNIVVSQVVKNVLTGQTAANSIENNCSYTILSRDEHPTEMNASQFEDLVMEKVVDVFMERSDWCQQYQEARRITDVQSFWKQKFSALEKRTTLLRKRMAKLQIKACSTEVTVRNVGTQLEWPYLDDNKAINTTTTTTHSRQHHI
ncbi:uncharacterized protein LOC126837435 [Adelges cooleyi]|uniref:uncharacterized protein LOC126837435 n=1 Tax=Adelges cooleyi TaxID=133065 RepID=UPI0021803F68|nr:uncharacterized protein LOC126837435 [Adelges cooleyi]